MGGGDRGTIVAIHDATADYQAGTSAIVPVIQVMLVVLVIFSLAGMGYGSAVCRLLTKTAQSITESVG